MPSNYYFLFGFEKGFVFFSNTLFTLSPRVKTNHLSCYDVGPKEEREKKDDEK